ncbi:hypothetical protein R1flu_014252 [Riccia fluitans]|uniref:Uncharacterized protein n=1 Tax=Riccia fluitans TaxID=41844 RepID=A0ABD1YFK9_9MARC
MLGVSSGVPFLEVVHPNCLTVLGRPVPRDALPSEYPVVAAYLWSCVTPVEPRPQLTWPILVPVSSAILPIAGRLPILDVRIVNLWPPPPLHAHCGELQLAPRSRCAGPTLPMPPSNSAATQIAWCGTP